MGLIWSFTVLRRHLEVFKRLFPNAGIAVALLSNSVSAAAPTGIPIPQSLLGEWVVTKVYEPDGPYPEPGAEPKVWLDGKTMVIESNRLSLGGEVCIDLDVTKKRGSIARILAINSGEKPSDMGLKPRAGAVDYLAIRCGHSFTNETSERTGIDYIEWYVVLDERNRSEIELGFFGGAYLELRRPAPTS